MGALPTRRVLVVHGAAAGPGTLAMDRVPGLIDRVVCVHPWPSADAQVMGPGFEGLELPLPSFDELLEAGEASLPSGGGPLTARSNQGVTKSRRGW